MTESATVCAIVGYLLFGCRRKLGAHADRDARNRHGHRCGQRLEALARAARGGRSHALDEWIDVEKASSLRGIQSAVLLLLTLAGTG